MPGDLVRVIPLLTFFQLKAYQVSFSKVTYHHVLSTKMKFFLSPDQTQVPITFIGEVENDDALVVIHVAKVVIIFQRVIV